MHVAWQCFFALSRDAIFVARASGSPVHFLRAGIHSLHHQGTDAWQKIKIRSRNGVEKLKNASGPRTNASVGCKGKSTDPSRRSAKRNRRGTKTPSASRSSHPIRSSPHPIRSLTRSRQDWSWTFGPATPIMRPVGSTNVYLLPLCCLVGRLTLFQPSLLAGLHSWPLSF